MTSSNRYLTSWEKFWSASIGAAGEIFWDADPAHAAQQDLMLFQNETDPQLPLVDLGCGSGTQAPFHANHFARVIGTEISPAAVEIARTKHAAPNASYRVLDVRCPDAAHAPHEEIGDANLYMLRVLRQLYAEGVASTFSHGSRDGDTQYRSTRWDKRNSASD